MRASAPWCEAKNDFIAGGATPERQNCWGSTWPCSSAKTSGGGRASEMGPMPSLATDANSHRRRSHGEAGAARYGVWTCALLLTLVARAAGEQWGVNAAGHKVDLQARQYWEKALAGYDDICTSDRQMHFNFSVPESNAVATYKLGSCSKTMRSWGKRYCEAWMERLLNSGFGCYDVDQKLPSCAKVCQPDPDGKSYLQPLAGCEAGATFMKMVWEGLVEDCD